MDINDLTKGVNQNNLNNTLKQFRKRNVERPDEPGGKHYKNTNQEQLKQQLSKIDPERD